MSGPIAQAWSEDFTARYTRDLYHCSNCNYCVDAVWAERGIDHVCVTMEHHNRAPGYSGRGFIEAARAVAEGREIDAHALAERVFTCTTCGNCETVCPIGLRPASIGRALRAELVAQNVVPEAAAALATAIIEQGNPYGAPRAAREAWAEDLTTATESDTVFFAGCAAAIRSPGEARAAVRVLEKAGVKPMLLSPDAQCCGAPLAELGYVARAGVQAEAVGARLVAGSPARVIALGCECRRHLEASAGLRALSFAAWLLDAEASGQIALSLDTQRPLRGPLRLIESCQLKRPVGGLAAGDEARVAALLARLGLPIANDEFPAPHAMCCGAAGGMAVMQPEPARRMGEARLDRNGVVDGIVLTLDGRCAGHLREVREEGVRVMGFGEFVEGFCIVEERV